MNETKKMAVLAVLKKSSDPLSLPEIIQVLGTDYPDRTVRRWLNEFVDDGTITKIGQKRGTKYKFIDTPDINRETINFSKKSETALNYVKKPLFLRQPTTYNVKWLEEYIPNQSFYLRSTIRDELLQAGDHGRERDPAGTYARHIYNRLLIDLSYNSSRLEGNTYSLLDTERLVIDGTSVEDKLDEEKVMILNHKEAIRFLVDNANKISISPENIRTIHYLLSEGLIARTHSGNLRDHGVRISSSTYIPFENRDELKKLLAKICEKAVVISNPYEQSLFLLVHLAYIQAFTDVNMRTSRLCANIPLIQNNLVPLSFNEVSKEDYTSAMIAIYELNETQPIVEIYHHSYIRTCRQYSSIVLSLGFDEVRVRYREQRRAMIRHIVVHNLIGKKLENYINEEISIQVNPKDQVDFREDLEEDLTFINPETLAGLGVTKTQLIKWKTKSNSQKK